MLGNASTGGKGISSFSIGRVNTKSTWMELYFESFL